MKTQYIKPKEELADIVDSFYIRKTFINNNEVISQYPSLHQELIFNFGDNIEVNLSHSVVNIGTGAVSLIGTQTKPISLNSANNHYCIGVIFKSWGLHKAFGIKSSLYTNRIVNASALMELKYLQFISEYARICTPMEVLNNIESWLIKNNKDFNISEDFKNAFDKYNESNTQKGAITKVSKDIMLCPKSFIEKFKIIIGVTPIQYLHIKLVNNAIDYLRENKYGSLTAISNELGFYDQAHFIRVFKAYCKITPGQYAKLYINNIYEYYEKYK